MDRPTAHVAYRAVLLAAALLVFGLVFRHLVTLLLAVLVTVIIAIPLTAAADRLERRGVPRHLGALLALLGGVLVLGVVIALLIPPFTDQTDQFVEDVPGIASDLRDLAADVTGAEPGEFGDRVQDFVRRYQEDPARLIGPLTSIGLNVAGVLGALLLILITSYYMAVNPRPLLDGLVRLAPLSRRPQARRIMARLREAWVGWMAGVAIDMFVTGTLVYIALTIVGLEFAVFFAVLSALLVVIPYFGAIAGAIPPILFALTDSPTKALIVLGVYVLVQQLESNVLIPLVMSQTVKLHPALIAIGVVVVGQLFGFVGLFVAVPILSLLQIGVDELWVKSIEEPERGPPLELDDGDHGGGDAQQHDRDLHRDPEPR
ncbi:MAG TPA: AI-2E family transporter [Thermoleophilaceae bacterium]|nr:AI-2E family transporter [Thermoleophilaceae bacterium]